MSWSLCWSKGVLALTGLQELTLQDCYWPDHEAYALISAVAYLSSLRHLAICRTHTVDMPVTPLHSGSLNPGKDLNVTPAAVVHALSGMAYAPLLNQSHGALNPLPSFGAECVPRMADAPRKANALVSVQLRALSLGDRDLERVCDALASSQHLTALDLSGHLCVPSVGTVLPVLQGCPCLAELLLCPLCEHRSTPVHVCQNAARERMHILTPLRSLHAAPDGPAPPVLLMHALCTLTLELNQPPQQWRHTQGGPARAELHQLQADEQVDGRADVQLEKPPELHADEQTVQTAMQSASRWALASALQHAPHLHRLTLYGHRVVSVDSSVDGSRTLGCMHHGHGKVDAMTLQLLKPLQQLTELAFVTCECVDAAGLSQLSQLQKLSLDDCNVTNARLVADAVARLPSLHCLSLQRNALHIPDSTWLKQLAAMTQLTQGVLLQSVGLTERAVVHTVGAAHAGKFVCDRELRCSQSDMFSPGEEWLVG
jgi:hypothetical protein